MSRPNVSYCRLLSLGVRGNDVIGYKRALSRAAPQMYKWGQFTDYFGPEFRNALVAYQRSFGLEADGRIGPRTCAQLAGDKRRGFPDEWAFDATAMKLVNDFCIKHLSNPDERIRSAIVSAGLYWYAHRYEISYSQTRPFRMCKPPYVPSTWDCSAFATNCHYAAGAPNPNGREYDGQGYTGTLMSTGVKVPSVSDLEVGDLIFYGYSGGSGPAFRPGDPTHVAVYAGLIKGVRSVISNGHHPMGIYAYNYRHDINHYRSYDVAGV